MANETENQIVVYQPNETIRLDVRLEDETVWLTQAQLCDLFGVVKSNVSYHLKNIYETEELEYEATVQKIRTVRLEAGRRVSRDIEYFNLDVIISLGYRINSRTAPSSGSNVHQQAVSYPLSAAAWASTQRANTSPCTTARSHQSAAESGCHCRRASVIRTCRGCRIPLP